MVENQAGSLCGDSKVSLQDPIADMLTRVRNAQSVLHESVTMMSSKIKAEIARVLKEEGYISDFSVTENQNGHKQLQIQLKYYRGKPVISRLKRVSKVGLRIYKSYKEINPVPGFGIYILSTPKGIMSHLKAKQSCIGGEILCEVA